MTEIKKGDAVVVNDYPGTVQIVHKGQLEGMLSVRLRAGEICVDATTVKRGHIFRNINYTQRNYECTNVVACIAANPPNDNYKLDVGFDVECLTPLWIENGAQYYGHL